MRTAIILLAVASIFTLTVEMRVQTAAASPVNSSQTKSSEPPIQSGVYGFSGGKAPGSDFAEGVVGECIWIFDEANKNQIAKGECSERQPGKFRVVLRPGRYVVHGPGGNKPIQVKPGQWINIESITLLPGRL
jgi:hypothetical protein